MHIHNRLFIFGSYSKGAMSLSRRQGTCWTQIGKLVKTSLRHLGVVYMSICHLILTIIIIYKLHKPLYEYNKARSFHLLPSTILSPPVIDYRSISTPIISTSVPCGGTTRQCTHCCSPPALTVPPKTTILYSINRESRLKSHKAHSLCRIQVTTKFC